MEGHEYIYTKQGTVKSVSESDFIAASQSTFDVRHKQPLLPVSALVLDYANICTLVGGFSSLLAIYYIIHETYYLGFCLLAVGSVLDILDGFIARRTANRDAAVGQFGAHMDTLVDVVNSAVGPAVFVFKISGNYSSIWPAIAGIVYALAICTRLGYFELVGMQTYYGCKASDSYDYMVGLTKDFAVGLLSIVVHTMPFISDESFVLLFSISLVALIPCLLSTRLQSYRIDGADTIYFVGFFIVQVFSFLFLHCVSTPSDGSTSFYQGSALLLQALVVYPLLLKYAGISKG